MKKDNFKKRCLLLVVLLIGIGFAALATSLNIRGSVLFKSNKGTFYFDNIVLDDKSYIDKEPVLLNRATEVSYDLEDMEPGDIYKFTVDIVNKNDYSVVIDSVNEVGIPDKYKDSFSSYIKYYDSDDSVKVDDKINKNSKRTIEVYIEYKEDAILDADIDEDLSLSFTVSKYEFYNPVKLVNVDSVDDLKICDEVDVDDQVFYVVSIDDSTITLISSYNLDTANEGFDQLKSNTYIKFSESSYWTIRDGSAADDRPIVEKYGTAYPINVFDDKQQDLTALPYLAKYQSHLNGIGLKEPFFTTIRLLTLEEGQTMYDKCPDILKHSRFWTSTATSTTLIYRFVETEGFVTREYSVAGAGIRPVIEIKKDIFEQ